VYRLQPLIESGFSLQLTGSYQILAYTDKTADKEVSWEKMHAGWQNEMNKPDFDASKTTDKQNIDDNTKSMNVFAIL